MENIGSGVSWSFGFLVQICDSGVTGGGERYISPDGIVGGGGLDSWSGGEGPD